MLACGNNAPGADEGLATKWVKKMVIKDGKPFVAESRAVPPAVRNALVGSGYTVSEQQLCGRGMIVRVLKNDGKAD